MTITQPGRHCVGSNLYKQIAASGAGSWVLRFQMHGKKRWMGLGPLAVFSLKEATALARAAQQQIYTGVDPIDARRATLATEARKAALTVSFEVAAGQYYDTHQAKWGAKSKTAFLNTMRDHVFPVFGQTAVADIDTPLVLLAIEPIWLSKNVTAGRVRGRIEAVLNWAAVRGYRPAGANPARWSGHLDQELPVGGVIGKVEHHEALPYADVPSFMQALQQSKGAGARALEVIVLSASRTAEIVGACWNEIDLENLIWTRPADRMKGRVEHCIPITPRMVEILQGLPREAGNDRVFIGTKAGQSLGKNAIPKLMASLGVDATIHGFRSSFRDWAAEQTDFANDIIEMTLAHKVGSKVELAYKRTDLIKKRRALMARWEMFVTNVHGDVVVPIGVAKKKEAS